MGLFKRLFTRPKLTKKPTRRQRVRLGVEPLEERVLLYGPTSLYWDGGGGDLFGNNPLNWSEDRLPDATDDLLIDAPQDLTIISKVISRSTV